MTFSLARRQVQVHERWPLVLSLWKRAAITIGIGLMLNLIPNFNFDTVRIPGCCNASVYASSLPRPSWYSPDGVHAGVVDIGLLCGLFGADARHASARCCSRRIAGAWSGFRCVCGSAVVIRALVGQVKTWDPEGLVSTLPAVSTLLFGVLAGHWLAAKVDAAAKTVWMLLAGLLCLWIGAMMDAVFMPINKSLWTPSYSVFMAGWALIVFTAFYWLMDAVDRTGTRSIAQGLLPFTIYGMNALFIFAFSRLVAKMMGFIKVGDPAEPLKALIFAQSRRCRWHRSIHRWSLRNPVQSGHVRGGVVHVEEEMVRKGVRIEMNNMTESNIGAAFAAVGPGRRASV